MNPTQAVWATETNVARARELWDAGVACAAIGRTVGCSLDAVVGWARRHAWGPHPKPPPNMAQRAALKAARLALQAAEPVPAPKAARPRQTPSPANGGLRVACQPEPLAVPTGSFKRCQWVLEMHPLRQCDAPTVRQGAWCASCRARVYLRRSSFVATEAAA